MSRYSVSNDKYTTPTSEVAKQIEGDQAPIKQTTGFN